MVVRCSSARPASGSPFAASRSPSWAVKSSRIAAGSGQSPSRSRVARRRSSAPACSPRSLNSCTRLRTWTASSGRSRVSRTAALAWLDEAFGLVELIALDADGGEHAVGGGRGLRSRPATALGDVQRLVGAAQGAREVAAQQAGQGEVRARGERGPLGALLGGHRVGTLEVLDRRIEVAGPHLDDPQLREQQATQVGRHIVALEHGATPEPFPRGREGARRDPRRSVPRRAPPRPTRRRTAPGAPAAPAPPRPLRRADVARPAPARRRRASRPRRPATARGTHRRVRAACASRTGRRAAISPLIRRSTQWSMTSCVPRSHARPVAT